MRIRSYQPEDRAACLAVLESNTPEHFSVADRAELVAFLDRLPGPYFVAEDPPESVVACGGIAQDPNPEVAALCWGMVHARRHRGGIGGALLKHRLASFLPNHPEVKIVRINTTQKVQAFYERHGFIAREILRDGYGPGLDHVRMEFVAEADESG